MKPQNPHTLTITTARQPTWRCAAIPTLSGCRPWRRLPITFRFPLFRGKEDGRQKHIKKQPALGFSMCRLLFQIRRMSGVQAAFYALCYAADAANFWRGGHLPPLPWERAGVRAFAALDHFGRAETLKSGYGGDTPCPAFEFAAAVRICFPLEWERQVGTLQKAACTLFFAYNTPCPTLFHHSGDWI